VNLKDLSERNALLYKQLNDLDDSRDRRLKADATGKAEPTHLYAGLYRIDEVDDSLVEIRERTGFVAIDELPKSARISNIAPSKRRRDPAPPKPARWSSRRRRRQAAPPPPAAQAVREHVPCVFLRKRGELLPIGGIEVRRIAA
jgi:hypothetical protein